jgi:hypothetical protein
LVMAQGIYKPVGARASLFNLCLAQRTFVLKCQEICMCCSYSVHFLGLSVTREQTPENNANLLFQQFRVFFISDAVFVRTSPPQRDVGPFVALSIFSSAAASKPSLLLISVQTHTETDWGCQLIEYCGQNPKHCNVRSLVLKSPIC